MKQYHILNGDILKEQFPDISGELIVARECLVDGDVNGKNLAELYNSRAKFISKNYRGYSIRDYYEKTVPEFQKIQDIPENSDINLWFEDDLFCQVNLWFVVTATTEEHLQAVLIVIEENTGIAVMSLPMLESYHIDLGFDLKLNNQ